MIGWEKKVTNVNLMKKTQVLLSKGYFHLTKNVDNIKQTKEYSGHNILEDIDVAALWRFKYKKTSKT